MFIVLLRYKKPLDVVDQWLQPHRAYLDECYAKNYFLASGPLIPRTGGLLISPLSDRAQLLQILHQDPFYTQEVAEYELMEFEAVKYHSVLTPLLQK